MASWGEPEQLTRYAARYSNVLALLGRVTEHDYYAQTAERPRPSSAGQPAIAGGANGERLVGPLTDFVVSFALVNEELAAA